MLISPLLRVKSLGWPCTKPFFPYSQRSRAGKNGDNCAKLCLCTTPFLRPVHACLLFSRLPRYDKKKIAFTYLKAFVIPIYKRVRRPFLLSEEDLPTIMKCVEE